MQIETLENTERVVLVNAFGKEIGAANKFDVHVLKLLHLAFSIFIFRDNGNEKELLLQRRALNKYHSAGLWSNTCCGHPRPGEDIQKAAERRLVEEMGIQTVIKEVKTVCYNLDCSNGLVEYEFNHLFIGNIESDNFAVNPDEVMEFRWCSLEKIKTELSQDPKLYSPWFPLVFNSVKHFLV